MPAGGKRLMHGYQEQDGRMYKVYTTPYNLLKAQLLCQQNGANLPNLITADDATFVKNVMGSGARLWISKCGRSSLSRPVC